ncbi:class I SAM-dependent methyltransferase [Ensifer soli]|uniref:class I SAM-dependent methyltransferase n=1 Tax=Ciceribacter sp. sgz301302 TaxID=3342379 RepID=UPI0035BAFBFD
MSGFAADWLALREPADLAARDRGLVAALAARLARTPSPLIVDLGCGTGSTFRALSPHLPDAARWRMVDNDPSLLREARTRIGPPLDIAWLQQDLGDVAALPLADATVVTASAFFDLCSAPFCDRLVRALSNHGCGLYAALTYDGRMRWSRPHPLDALVTRDVNLHQRTDKGFGPALGPEATTFLADALRRAGFHVHVTASDWCLTAGQAALQAEFLDGLRAPLAAIGRLSAGAVADWLGFRKADIGRPGAWCLVGHRDLLAFAP